MARSRCSAGRDASYPCFRSVAVIAALLAPVPLLAEAPGTSPDTPRELVQQAWGIEDPSILSLTLPPAPPDRLEVTVEDGDGPMTLHLRRHSLRSPGFSVRAWLPEGETVKVDAPAPATYRGTVAGVIGSAVAASLGVRGLRARILCPGEEPLLLRPLGEIDPGAAGSAHVLFRGYESVPLEADCLPGREGDPACDRPLQVAGHPASPFPGSGGLAARLSKQAVLGAAAAGIGDDQHLAEIAFDVDYQYYQLKGSSVAGSVAAVEAIMNEIDFMFARDVMVTYQITDILVRTSQYYFPEGGGDLLSLFQEEWTTNQAGVPHDLAHLMTHKDNIQFGGLSWIGTVCGPLAYGWSRDNVRIVAHEVGHNWGALHGHDLYPCNIMSGGCLAIGPNLRQTMIEHRDSRDCLDLIGARPDPLPPYAYPDRIEVTRDDLAVMGPTPLDVLENDHDGNLDLLSIESLDPVSNKGATIQLSPGTGPDGRDELIYVPTGHVFQGKDRFEYVVGDGTGLRATGIVTVEVISAPSSLEGHWKLDDAVGEAAADSSGKGRHGALSGNALWVQGLQAGALELGGGADDYVTLPPMDINGNEVTVSAWLKRQGDQNNQAGIVYCSEGSTEAGLIFGFDNELRYSWNMDIATYTFDTGLVVPNDQWVFVAMVVEPERATLYLHDGTTRTAFNAIPHAPEAFDGTTYLGAFPGLDSRRFRGALDDVRVYSHAMSDAEIEDLIRGGKASNPYPHDDSRVPEPVAGLSWSPGLGAEAHDVYFGGDYLAVRDATHASPEYRGRQGGLFRAPPVPLSTGETWFWRIDEIIGPAVVRGDVWLFEVIRPVGHWRLDETFGPVAEDHIGGNHGTYTNAPLLGEPGATPVLGNSMTIGGWGQRVEVPPFSITTDTMTITSWVRREGDQTAWAGIVFSCAGNTESGLEVGTANELRYHWDRMRWRFDSGLVLPDGEWAFTALVVSPDRAVIYMGRDGTLLSSVNPQGHAPEGFQEVTCIGGNCARGSWFVGGIDDVRIYDAALTETEVWTFYRDGLVAPAAGEVPDGARVPGDPVKVVKAATGGITLEWSSSCRSTDTDYAVYEGLLGDFTSHEPKTCGTGGVTSISLTPAEGPRYFLIVPSSEGREGSYGRDSSGSPRLPGEESCFPQAIGECG